MDFGSLWFGFGASYMTKRAGKQRHRQYLDKIDKNLPMDREKSCLSKAALSLSTAQEITRKNRTLRYYECEYCKKFHMTSSK